jgi:glycosyltransferase involved in cell wall biosynthesis
VESILRGIDPNEFDVVLFCRGSGPYKPREETEIEEIASPAESRRAGRSRPAIPEWVKLWAGFGREAFRLADVFRRQPVDLLHTNNAGCEESAVAARLAGVPRVLGTFHVDSTYDLTRTRSGLRHRVLEIVSNHCLHAAIAVSDATSRDWIRRTRLSPRRVTTIHNGVDPQKCAPTADRAALRRRLGLPAGDAIIVGGVGRLDAAKGFDVLLNAIAVLAPQYPQLRLALAGDGPLRQTLEGQAQRLGIRDRIHFLGFCPNVNDVYGALDIFAMPSRCEALPYALLEAMAAELPAVATCAGGVPEIVAPGETGFLVPIASREALAAALGQLLEDADLRRRMGRAGRARVLAHFSEREMVTRTLELYRRLLWVSQSPIRSASLRLAA